MQAKSRRPAREAALRALYQMGIGRSSLGDAIADMREHAEMDDELVDYADRLVRGVDERSKEIKAMIEERLTGWEYDRLSAIDRTLLRIGAYEIVHVDEVPPVVAMNEAIELAKKYSTAESGKFVNGILAKVWADYPRAPAPGTPAEEPASDPAEPVEEAVAERVTPDSDEWTELEKSGALKPVGSDEIR